MIAVGFGMLFVGKHEKIKAYGGMLMGLGLVFFGMHVMGEAMHPLRSYQPFLDLMQTMTNPLLAVLVSAIFTGIIQSSSATTAIVIVMASQGFISLDAGVPLVMGANIGTCVTALLAAIGKPREAVRCAIVHTGLACTGVLMWLPFVSVIGDAAVAMSPVYPELSGMELLAAETPRQIANAHTFFNVANGCIFIWFTTYIARAAEWLVPDKPLEEEAMIVRTKFLQTELLTTPTLALDSVRMEVMHMGETVNTMLKGIMPAIIKGDVKALEEIRQMDDTVDILHAGILDYMAKISKQPLLEEQTKEMMQLMEAVSNLENIGDIVETNLVVLGQDRVRDKIEVSEQTQAVLNGFQAAISKAVAAAVMAVAQRNERSAQVVTGMKDERSTASPIRQPCTRLAGWWRRSPTASWPTRWKSRSSRSRSGSTTSPSAWPRLCCRRFCSNATSPRCSQKPLPVFLGKGFFLRFPYAPSRALMKPGRPAAVEWRDAGPWNRILLRRNGYGAVQHLCWRRPARARPAFTGAHAPGIWRGGAGTCLARPYSAHRTSAASGPCR